MRGAKPDQIVERSDESLQSAEIHPPRELLVSTSPQISPSAGQGAQINQEVVKRFEEIMKQELQGSSFSAVVDRGLETSHTAKIQAAHSRGSKQSPTRPLGKAKRATQSPFEGLTILDKFVSFVAYLLKSFERKIFGGPKKLLPLRQKKNLASAAVPKEDLELNKKQAQKRAAGTTSSATRPPQRGASFQ